MTKELDSNDMIEGLRTFKNLIEKIYVEGAGDSTTDLIEKLSGTFKTTEVRVDEEGKITRKHLQS